MDGDEWQKDPTEEDLAWAKSLGLTVNEHGSVPCKEVFPAGVRILSAPGKKKLTSATTGFHGSYLPGLQTIIPDPQDRKVMSSLGTWATMSPDHTLIYGDKVYEVEIPDGNYLDATGVDNFDVFWFDESLVSKHLDPKLAKSLFSQAGGPVRDYFAGRARDPGIDSMRPAILYTMRAVFNGVQELIFRNWGYLKEWRAKRQSLGYDGVVWHNSGIDVGKDRPHTVYLVWGPMKVVREFSPEERSPLVSPR